MTNDLRETIQEERDWRAFRYVTGEMKADEAAAYERDLAGDEAACQAVAQAVELVEAIGLVAPGLIGVAPGRSNRVLTRRSWRLAAAGSLLATAALLALLAIVPGQVGWWRSGESDPAGELAVLLPLDTVMAWTSLRSDPTDREPDSGDDSFIGDGEAGPSADAAESPVPSWMIELAAFEPEQESAPEAPREN